MQWHARNGHFARKVKIEKSNYYKIMVNLDRVTLTYYSNDIAHAIFSWPFFVLLMTFLIWSARWWVVVSLLLAVGLAYTLRRFVLNQRHV